MDEMISYIFGSMKTYDHALVKIHRVLKYQNKINRRFALCSMLTGVGFILVGAHIQMQNETIEQLRKEMKKMQEPTEGCTDTTETEN